MRFTNNEKSYGRNRRLFSVVSWYWNLLESHGCGQDRGGKYAGLGTLPLCSTPIHEINDHKGLLTIHWDGEPTPTEKRLIELAWLHAGDEPSSNVQHITTEVFDGV